jgi:acylphosphatase
MYIVHGRVQGVGFRYFVERAARELDLAGYVKNRADSTVEVYAVGGPEQLDRLEKHLWAGPSFSRVDSVERRETDHEPMSERRIAPGFRIEY